MRCKCLFYLLLLAVTASLSVAQTEGNASSGNSQQNSSQQGSPLFSPDGVKVGEQPADAPPPEVKPVPKDVIIVKGAWASASDSSTPLPEDGSVVDAVYRNQYFGFSYALPADWYQKFQGPPPSDSGFYTLVQLQPAPSFKGPIKGTVLVSAQDLFFTLTPARNTTELVKFSRDSLKSDYKVEREPIEVKIADHSFLRFDYVSPVAGLHWYLLTTEIRCHAVQFVFISRDTRMMESLIEDMSKLKLPAGAGVNTGLGGGEAPVCIKDYAIGKNVLHRVDPILTDRKFNPIPVRIIISKTGRVKHIHFLSAWPEQAEIITNALFQWEFKPYLQNGEPVEVETGIMFGQSPRTTPPGKGGKPAVVTN